MVSCSLLGSEEVSARSKAQEWALLGARLLELDPERFNELHSRLRLLVMATERSHEVLDHLGIVPSSND